jgi:hypothetical protein
VGETVDDRRESSVSPTAEQTMGKPFNIPDSEVPEKTHGRNIGDEGEKLTKVDNLVIENHSP